MSQAGIIEFESAHPQVPTIFVTNVGTAVPLANVLEILGTTVAAHSIPLETTGTANIVTVVAQYASATATTTTTAAGFASFKNTQFTVDANGFVSTNGTGVGNTITGQTGGPLSPTAGNWNIFGGTQAAGTTPVHTSGSGSTLTTIVQISQAIAATDATKIGLSAFNSADFTVDANGFVSLAGGVGPAILTLTGNAGGAIPPDGSGNINILFAHTNILVDGSGHTLTADFLDPTFGNLIMGSTVAQTLNPLNAQNLTGYGSAALNAVVSSKFCAAFGGGALQNLTTGLYNTMCGASSGSNLTTSSSNTGVGYGALNACVTGTGNCCIGSLALEFALGSNNIAVGANAGVNYTGTEGSNILVGHAGVLGESNVMRLGTAASQTSCFVSGITGVTVAASAPVGVASTGQLSSLGFGTATYVLTSNGAGASPTWQPVIPGSFPWVDASGVFTAAINTGYFLTAASTPTLPAAPAQGDIMEFAADASALTTITANTGQVIQYGSTTSAAAGTLATSIIGSTVRLVYRSTGAKWVAIASMGSSWTVT